MINSMTDAGYYMGWVVQPLDERDDAYYVYEPTNTRRPSGVVIRGGGQAAAQYIEKQIAHEGR